MTVVEMKNKLHQQIDVSDERLIKMIYALVNEYGKDAADIDDLRKSLVRKEREQYLAGTSNSYTWDEVKNMAVNNHRP